MRAGIWNPPGMIQPDLDPGMLLTCLEIQPDLDPGMLLTSLEIRVSSLELGIH